MAITEGMLLQVTVEGIWYEQQVMNVWTFEVTGTFSGISAGAVATAFWNHVKGPYRALVASGFGPVFSRVTVREMGNATGEYGEYAIPEAERTGTRDAGGAQGMPPFNAAGVRLAVETRVTRPGQKRIPWLLETDSEGQGLNPGFAALVNTLVDAVVPGATLLAPALGMDLLCVVVRVDKATGAVLAHQPVVSWTVSPYTSSQTSRKVGRGA